MKSYLDRNKKIICCLKTLSHCRVILNSDLKMSVSESTVSGFCHYRGKENTLKIRETNKWVTGIVIE